jgi:uncharacterized protein (DUF1697 family)
MATYIAMLRGINVSGQKIIPMADLKALFLKLGLKDAKTFIQSGNVVFTSPAGSAVLVGKIEAGIRQAFGFDVTVVLKTLPELSRIVKALPFQPKEGERAYITYLAEAPEQAGVKALEAARNEVDDFVIAKAAVYILVRAAAGYGKTLFSNNFVEKKLKVRATSRNLETSLKLIALAEGL